MRERFEYVLAAVAIAFGSQWAIRFFQNYKSKSQGRKDDIDNLNSIIEQMRKEIHRLEEKIDRMQNDFEHKEKAYLLAYRCDHSDTCPVLKKLNI